MQSVRVCFIGLLLSQYSAQPTDDFQPTGRLPVFPGTTLDASNPRLSVRRMTINDTARAGWSSVDDN